MKIKELDNLLEKVLSDLDNLDIGSDDIIIEPQIYALENDFGKTMDLHSDFMMEALGGTPDEVSLDVKKAVFRVMVNLHQLLSVQDQMELPN